MTVARTPKASNYVSHDELVIHVARSFDPNDWMVWTEPMLGARTDVSCSPDVLAIRKSWSNYEVRVVECKVTQSDLDGDLRALKFEKYFQWCDRISFATANGLKTAELEKHPVGLMQHTGRKSPMTTKRAPPKIPFDGERMTRHFFLFHSLNMSDKRWRNGDRFGSVLRAWEARKMVDIRGELKDLDHQIRVAFERQIRELQKGRRETKDHAEEERSAEADGP